ncbi:putative adhesin [Actinokineospora sp. NBRC 105648]|uniref:putative adhesin n=1 Tax=Actinokineospora sp. NBRC 105648 TaxID=3032206 RepID=UPI0024A5D0EF|nr:hypothetical protein [Actinokineospora sp. NBRC 105648]GLZ42634.1 hypothetical protein Acsp05_62580 [Actinokineospora sp. NBRC 105648]
MVGIVLGHGSHDGTDIVTVPKGLPVHFYTDEGSPLLMVNLLELLGRDHHRTPMQTLAPGTPVPNYKYEPFKPHELRAFTAYNQLEVPQLLIGSATSPATTRLCADPAHCPKDGPHTCGGVFDHAAKGRWTKLLVLSCRIHTGRSQQPTVALMTATGKRDTSVFDALFAWVTAFVALDPAGQDARWAALSERERVRLVAVEDELREWADCLALRTAIASADRPKAAALVAAAPTSVRFRLVRDYPRHRELVRAEPALSPAERQAIAAFQRAPFGAQITQWLDLTQPDQVRWLTEPAIASWATAFNALELFDLGLVGDQLMGVLRRLDPAAQGVALTEPRLVDYLAHHSLRI